MKKLLLLASLSLVFTVSAQLETSLRWVGIGPVNGLNFFLNDSTDLVQIDCDFNSAYAIFTNPNDSLLYGLIRGEGEAYGNNNLYVINPFSGDLDLVIDFSATESTSATINTDGSIIYLIDGGGGGTLGDITAYNTLTGVETPFYTAFGTEGESTYGMAYHPLDDQIYIYEGSEVGDTRLQKIDITSLTNEVSPLVGFDGFVSGAMWQGVDYEFIVNTSYDCSFLKTVPLTTNELQEFYSSCMPETSDIAEIYTVYAESDSIAICPSIGDSTTFELIYDVNSFQWYKDGVLLPDATSPILTVGEPGVYQAAMEIKTTSAMLFSKPITVYTDPLCNVSITEMEKYNIQLYPNPVKDQLTITSEVLINMVSITDLKGNVLLFDDNLNDKALQFDLSNFSKGVYLINITTANGTHIEKIVK